MDQSLTKNSVHKLFADNLRKHCTRFASIAELCRLTGINRPQFNRYLSGQNLPNPRTMAKLCAVLDVQETTLFAPSNDGPQLLSGEFARIQDLIAAIDQGGRTGYGQLLKTIANSKPVDLPSGYYYLYTPLTESPHMMVRILVKVTNDGKLARFTRRTVLKNSAAGSLRMAIGRHSGLIISDQKAVTLLGANRLFPYELSFIRISSGTAVQQAPHMGLAMLHTPQFGMACRVCLEWCGAKFSDGKRAMANLGQINLADPNVSDAVRTVMTPTATDPNFITSAEHELFSRMLRINND